MSNVSIVKAKEALDRLERLSVGVSSSGKKLKEGLIFALIDKSSGKRYIGSEYEGNIEKYLKELILRAEAFKLQGSIFHDSYEVMKEEKVIFELIERLFVSKKLDLSKRALMYIKSDVKTSNIWYPEDILKSYEEKDWRVLDGKDRMINYKDKYMKIKLEEAKLKHDNVKKAFNDNISLIKARLDELYEERILFYKSYK
jgi:hypothetical protein